MIKIFFCGDVMTGRAIDQILPNPNTPELYEPYLKNAKDYIVLAETISGPLSYPVDLSYIWGDALEDLKQFGPNLKLINLETAITQESKPYPKGINYRMHPKNIPCLTAAGIDGCALANNHILDWSHKGLLETLETLRNTGLSIAGAGKNCDDAYSPAIFPIEQMGRVLFFSVGMESSGIPKDWAATEDHSGVALLPDLQKRGIEKIEEIIQRFKEEKDFIILSIHWGDNWGYEISREEREFSHEMIDHVGVDVIHGHSSHHPKGIEVYHGKPIFYGCGDFINDYEGIGGHEKFRGRLGLMYFVTHDISDKTLRQIEMVPTHLHKFQVRHAYKEEAEWLERVLNRESSLLNTGIEKGSGERLQVKF